MGTTMHGFDEWLEILQTLPERAPDAFKRVVGRGALNIKNDWKERWRAVTHPKGHIPHLLRGIGYDVSEHGDTFEAEIGVNPTNRQAFLAEIIESGTLTSAPHPAAVPALEAEAPVFARYVGEAAEKLLDDRGFGS